MRLSVVIPAYNEEARLPAYLETIIPFLTSSHPDHEIVVVNDGSCDGTADVVARFSHRNPNIRLVSLPQNLGKGCAVRVGMLEATGQLRLFADADGATPVTELAKLMSAVKKGADVAIGSRAVAAADAQVKSHLHRKVMGTVFNFLVGLLAVRGIKDTQCGFKLFTAESAERIFALQRIAGFGFDVETLFLCNKLGYRVKEVPVNWADVRGSKVRLVYDSLRMLADILHVRKNDWLGVYQARTVTGGAEPAEKPLTPEMIGEQE